MNFMRWMMKVLKKPAFWIVTVAVSVLLTGILHRLDTIDKMNDQKEQSLSPTGVYTVKVGKGEISSWVVGEGTALAVRKRHLVFETSGKVVFIARDENGQPLREGSRIRGPGKGEKSGQVLARLDKRGKSAGVDQNMAGLSEAKQNVSAMQAALAQARSTLTVASADFERNRTLHRKKLIPGVQFERARAGHENAKAGVKSANAELAAARSRVKNMEAGLHQARIDVEHTAIFAPFDGVIARLGISEGDYYNLSGFDQSSPAAILETAPITVIDPGELEITLNLPIFDGMYVQQGQFASVTWGGIDWLETHEREETGIFGMVHSVSPVLNIGGRTVRIKVRVRQKEELIVHGMFVTCRIEVEKKKDVLLLPPKSLLYRDDKPYVYVIEDGRAVKRGIEIGLTDENRVEVLKGVIAGEEVATKGKYRLHDGSKIKILKIEQGII